MNTEERPPGGEFSPGEGVTTVLIRESKALVSDLTEWVTLKMEHTRLEIEARVNHQINEATNRAVAGTVWLLALLFFSVALALGLGTWLGHAAWGFVIVAFLYAGTGAYIWLRKPRMVRISLPRIEKTKQEDGTSGGTVAGGGTAPATETAGN